MDVLINLTSLSYKKERKKIHEGEGKIPTWVKYGLSYEIEKPRSAKELS